MAIGHAKVARNHGRALAVRNTTSGLPHVVFGYLRHWIQCAYASVTMRDHVALVRAVAVPSKIRQAIVGRVAVVVTRLGAIWAWANECFENQSADVPIASGRSIGKIDHRALVGAASSVLSCEHRGCELVPRRSNSRESPERATAPDFSGVRDGVARIVFKMTERLTARKCWVFHIVSWSIAH